MRRRRTGYVLAVLAAAAGRGVADKPWNWALYRMLSADSHRPAPVETVRVRLGPAEGGLRWWSMEIDPFGDAAPFRVILLSESVPIIGGDRGAGRVVRYQVEDKPGRVLEYVDAETGQALLPEFDFARNFLPVPFDSDSPLQELVKSARMIGHLLVLQETGSDEKLEPGTGRGTGTAKEFIGVEPVVLRLDKGLLVGTGRNFKNAKPGRITDPGKDYEYARFLSADYDEMIAAGINLFTVDAEQESWIAHRPVFYVRGDPAARYPLAFYRSNFQGTVQFADEPAVFLSGDKAVHKSARRPADLARLLEARVRATFDGDGPPYVLAHQLARHLAASGVVLGDMDLVDRDIPIWETLIETAWYQLAAGGSGMILEARYSLDGFRGFCRSLVPDADPIVRDMLLLDVARLRGAARAHGKDWGISIYGQSDPAISPEAVTLAYDAGARYVWYWTSDHGHHLPYEEQLDLTKKLREHAAAKPRGPRGDLRRAAKAAVALPDGAALGHPWIAWQPENLTMDAPLPSGNGTYRQALQGALREALRLAREGTPYDIGVDDEALAKAGYEQVLRPWSPSSK